MELPQKRSYQQLIRRKFSLPTASLATQIERIRRQSADSRYTIVGICAMAKKVSLGPAWNLSVLTKSIICLLCSLSPFPRQLSRNEKLFAAAPPIISSDLLQLQISIDSGTEYW